MTVVVLARDLNPTADRLVTTLTGRGCLSFAPILPRCRRH